MNAADFVSRLGANGKPRQTSTGWQCRCPAHDDGKSSLCITQAADKVLIHCQAGCTPQAVCEAAGVAMKDLFTTNSKPHSNSKPQIVATYDYKDESGKLLLQAVRFEPKDFRQRRPDATAPDGWTWTTKDVRRVLYRLPEIIRDVQRGLPIVVCEGEKDVDALVKLGFSATCNLGGAGKWRADCSDTLRGASVWIIADKDEPGRKHAQAIAASLSGIAKFVAVLELADSDRQKVKDAADFIAAGATVADFQAELDDAKEWTPQAEPLVAETDAEQPAAETLNERLASVRFNILNAPPEEPAVFELNRATIATRGNISAITAQAKAGKSAWLAALCAAAITPKPDDCDLLGVRAVNPEGLPVLLLDTEHSPFHHHALCDRILRRAMLTETELLHGYRLAGFSVPDLNTALEHLIAERKWLAVIIDGTGDFVADVNDPEECNAFVARLHGLAIQNDTHILNVLHLNPGSDFKSRGHLGSQLERKAESNLRIEKADEVSVVFADKNRGSAIPKSTGPRFAWSSGKMMHVSVATVANRKAAAKTEEMCEQLDEALRIADKKALHWKELVAALLQVPGINSERTAARIVSDLKSQQLIRKNLIGQLEKTP